MKQVFLALCVLASLGVHAHAYHVLCVLAVPSTSHHKLGKGIVDALAKAGHEVTWVSSYPDKNLDKKVRQIIIDGTIELMKNMDLYNNSNDYKALQMMREFSVNVTRLIIENEEFRRTIVDTQFDAAVTEWFFSDYHVGFAAVQQVPWVLLDTINMYPHMEYLVDEVRSVPVLPPATMLYPVPMTFFQRIKSSLMFAFMYIDMCLYTPSEEAIYSKEFGSLAKLRGVTLPPYQEALHNVSLVLVNSHPSFHYAQSLPPNAIEVAGYHIEETIPPLPQDLQELLDSSSQGLVYFSMGSILKSANLSARVRGELLALLGALPYNVLWKFEEKLEGLPKNVHVRPWMPQHSILAHKNVKVFITHGGLLSQLETLYHGVPVVAVPVFGDQPSNAHTVETVGLGLAVPYGEDMVPKLKEALDKILADDTFSKKAKQLSKLFRDRPVTPSKMISHYIETVIQSKGAFHLRSKARLYAWYQRWMVDQVLALIVVLYALYAIVRCAVKSLYIFLTKKKSKDVGKKKKDKKV